MSAAAYFVIRHEVPDAIWTDFHQWNAREFVPVALRELGYRSAAQYRSPGPAAGVTLSWTYYEAESADAAEAFRRRPEGRRLLEALQETWGKRVSFEAVVMERFHEARLRRRAPRPPGAADSHAQ